MIETPRPQIIHPDELKAFLDSLRRSLDDPRLWAWLVCKLGLTVKRASELTLADIKMNEQGRCVLRPYEAWILLPKQIESIVLGLADALYPIWRSGSDTALTKLRLLSSVNETSCNFSTLYLQNKDHQGFRYLRHDGKRPPGPRNAEEDYWRFNAHIGQVGKIVFC